MDAFDPDQFLARIGAVPTGAPGLPPPVVEPPLPDAEWENGGRRSEIGKTPTAAPFDPDAFLAKVAPPPTSDFRPPAPGVQALATTFGFRDPIDNGRGAWGDATNNPTILGAALPIATLREKFGDENKAHGRMVRVTNPATGQSITVPIVDKGPAEWVIARQGPTIDLTHAATQAIGGTGKTPVTWEWVEEEKAESGNAESGNVGDALPNFDPDAFLAKLGNSAQVIPKAEVVPAAQTAQAISDNAKRLALGPASPLGATLALGRGALQMPEKEAAKPPPLDPEDGDLRRRFVAGVAKNSADAIAGAAHGVALGETALKQTAADAVRAEARERALENIGTEEGSAAYRQYLRARKVSRGIEVKDAQWEPVAEFFRDVGERSAEDYHVDPRRDHLLSSKLASGVSSLVPAVASGPAAPLTIAAMMGEQQRQDAIEHGAGEKEAEKSFALGAGVGALSEALLGVPALLRSAKAAGMDTSTFMRLVRGVAWQTAKSSAREGTQEGLEQLAQNTIANAIVGYDPERKTFDGVAESAFLGALIGAPLGTLAGGSEARESLREEDRAGTAMAAEIRRMAAETSREATSTAAPPGRQGAAVPGGSTAPGGRSTESSESSSAPSVPGELPAVESDAELDEDLGSVAADNRVALLAEAAGDPTLTPEQREDAVRLWAEERTRRQAWAEGREERAAARAQRAAATNAEMEAASRAETQAELDAENAEKFYELEESILSLGGLPALSTAKGKEASGELRRLHEAFAHKGKRGVNLKYFRKNALGLDELRENLNARGFDFETVYDMIEAIERRFATGEKMYGTRDQGGVDASRIPFVRRPAPDTTKDLFEVPFNLAGETTEDGARVQRELDQKRADEAEAKRLADEQPTLFARRPYEKVPDSLMGFPKEGPTKPYEEQNWRHRQAVRVTWPDGHSIVDAVRGLNQEHALERARRNWRDAAKIETATREEFDDYSRQISHEGLRFAKRAEPVSSTAEGDAPLQREAAQASAEAWWTNVLKLLGPGAGRQLRVRLGDPAALREAGLDKPGSVPADAQAAWSAKLRSIFLLNKGLELRAEGGDVLNLLHESGHAFYDTLPAPVREALADLWKAETEHGRGPLYREGALPANADPRIERDAGEWFAERVAFANMEWAKRRLAAAKHDGSLWGSIAARMRYGLLRARQSIFDEGADVVTRRMRRFMNKGAAAYEATAPVRFRANSEDDRRATVAQRTAETTIQTYSNGEVTGPAVFAIRAHHGTPHKVDRFSTEKIGTGEGAQVYGWGLYFAENRQVANEYADGLTAGFRADGRAKPWWVIDGQTMDELPSDWSETRKEAARALALGDATKAKAELEQQIAGIKGDRSVEKWAEEFRAEIDALENRVQRVRPDIAPRVYTVELDVEPEDLLDWDKPLSEQSAKVKAALAPLQQEYRDREGSSGTFYISPHATGEQIYKEIWTQLIRTGEAKPAKVKQQEASERLAALGLPGIRYLDQGSRNILPEAVLVMWQDGRTPTRFADRRQAEEFLDANRERGAIALQDDVRPTYNYVLFDDSKIKIVAENDTPVQFARRPSAGPSTLSSEEALFEGPAVPRARIPFTTKSFPTDIHGLYEGAADRFLRTRGLEFLGRAIRRHVDRARALQGALTAPFRAWEGKYKAGERKQALGDFETFWSQRARNELAADTFYRTTATPAARELIDLWRAAAGRIDTYNHKLDIQVKDEGRWRPIRKVRDYFPRSLKPEVRQIIGSPKEHAQAYRELLADLIAEEGHTDRAKVLEALVAHAEKGTKLPPEIEAQRNTVKASLDAEFRDKSYTDFLGNIEAARRLHLPHRLYDYSFAAARKYLLGWSERAAQIEAFGQFDTKHVQGPKGSKSLFDVALERTHDETTKEYISKVRDRAYSERLNGWLGKTLAGVGSLATGLQLANPLTIGVNVLTGLGYNATTMGLRHSLRGLAELRKLHSTIDDAHARGLLLDDMMSMMHDADQYGSGTVQRIQRFTGAMLKYSGYNASETFVRAHGLLTAKSFLREALAAHEHAPNGRRARLYAAWFGRNNIDAAKLMAERGSGITTDRFYREAVNAGQGGYRYDQVPIFTDTPIGRFLFKYQKWGTQAARNFVKNALDPLLRPGVDAAGQKNPRTIVPLLRYLVVTGALGAAIGELKEAIFGSPDSSASLEEIGKTLDEKQARGLALLGSKIVNAWLAAGAGGIIGNYYQGLRDVSERSRFKNPLNPPAIAPLNALYETALRLKEQGGKLTLRDIDELLRASLSAYRTLESATARGLDAAGAKVPPFNRESARQDLAWLGTITRRYAAEIGVEANRTQIGRVGKTPSSPVRTALRDALLLGDTAAAKAALSEALEDFRGEDRKAELRSIGASVRASQPIRIGVASEARRVEFLRWARRRLDADDVARIREIDHTYRRTAAALGLLDDEKEPTAETIDKAMGRIRAKAGR